MSDTNSAGTILIKEDTCLPANLLIESERSIEGANWSFFYLAGEIRATVLGRDQPATLRRAVKRVLAKQEGQKFNSLEITKAVSKRFLGIPFMSVTAHSRHIQQGIGLVPAEDFVLRMPAAPNGEVATRQYVALISSS